MMDAADGDRRAIDPLYALLWPVATAYATRLLGDAALAEDAAQDALVRLFGQVARFDPTRADALTWALTLVTWECRTVRRRRTRAAGGHARAPEATADHRTLVEERDAIRTALAALATLSAADIDIITDPDALRAQLAPATFRKRLERALGRLRLSWRSRHGT